MVSTVLQNVNARTRYRELADLEFWNTLARAGLRNFSPVAAVLALAFLARAAEAGSRALIGRARPEDWRTAFVFFTLALPLVLVVFPGHTLDHPYTLLSLAIPLPVAAGAAIARIQGAAARTAILLVLPDERGRLHIVLPELPGPAAPGIPPSKNN